MSEYLNNIDDMDMAGMFNNIERSKVTFDIDKYKALLDDPSLSEAEKEEFLKALWSIVVAFVELGFGVHPLQEVIEDEGASTGLKRAFDSAGDTESNGIDVEDGCPISGLEIE